VSSKIGIKRICVLSPQSPPGLSLSTIANEALQELGFNSCASERAEDLLKSDVVLIFSGMRYPNPSLETIGQLKTSRPKVILWQIDPVPPPEFTPEAEKTGVLIHKFSLNTVWGQKHGKKVKKYIPLSHQFIKAAKWILSFKIEKQLEKIEGYSIMPSDGSEWGRFMERYLTLKEYLDRGLIDFSFTSSIAREKFFISRGMPVKFVPLGYHPQLGRLLNLRRDKDVLFLGRINNTRRRVLIDKIARGLEKHSISFTIVDESYDETRTELLNRAKIILDIPRVPWETGGIRFLMAMSCGALVVSLNAKYTAPYEPDVHFVSCTEQNIIDSIRHYLSNPVKRQKIIDNAYELVTKNITATKMMAKVMEACNAYPAF
jgi:hypothetical protein